MAQTVVGIFERESFARQAVEHLKESGYTQSDIDVHVRNTGDGKNDPADSDSGSGGILGFFKSLFKNDDDDAKSYLDLAGRNEAVVTVWVQSGSDAERAAEILDHYGSVKLDDDSSGTDGADESTDRDMANIETGIRSGTDTEIKPTNTATSSSGASMAAKGMSSRSPVSETAGTGNTGAGTTHDADDEVQIGGTGQSPTGSIGSGTVQTGTTGVAGTGERNTGSSRRSRIFNDVPEELRKK